jgi:hypothetical protein
MLPTQEQIQAIELFQTRQNLKLAAFAGAGKTSTLKMLANSSEHRGLYLAFNRKTADEAKAGFPGHVDCRTTHSIAFQAIKGGFSNITKLTSSIFPKQLAALRQYRKMVFSPTFALSETQLAFLVLKTVTVFCQNDHENLSAEHFPKYGALLGQKPDVIDAVRNWVLKEARSLWIDMTDVRTEMPLGHDGYLKLWALSEPTIGASYILLDEAQDSNPAVLGVLRKQQCQIVYVGDKHQQIYEWRGAIDAMSNIETTHSAFLTKSFRFGPKIADCATRVLRTLGEGRAITGNESISSTISVSGSADAILARTNATVISEVVRNLDEGRKPYIFGGSEDLKRLIDDVFELKKRRPARSPEFFGFSNWPEVVAFALSEEGTSLQSFVKLVESKGEIKLWKALSQVAENERDADVVISTAHKAKGCEWQSVRLAEDFVTSNSGDDCKSEEEIRLFYVALTRARERLIISPEILETFI